MTEPTRRARAASDGRAANGRSSCVSLFFVIAIAAGTAVLVILSALHR